MREKELRLALVCYGGVSLAVYMHGITKEIWRLAQASRAYHDGGTPPSPSGAVYIDLLKTVETATGVKLRVLADIIAGASAGGINGIFLARAVATGQSLDPLTELWLNSADISKLIDPESYMPSRFSKLWARPLVWALGGRLGGVLSDDSLDENTRDEIREKLMHFVRARWFQPPFAGDGFCNLLLDAFDAMAAQPAGTRLLPDGQPLDLFVTVTDFHGHPERLRLNSPPEVVETEHRLTFSYRDESSTSDTLGDTADLVFAARSTASFPGAFPPFMVAELDGVLAARKRAWPGREAFLARSLARRAAIGAEAGAVLIDGSVLANAPFLPAIEALKNRPARREVDRRFVYIDPKPGIRSVKLTRSGQTELPGFFTTIFGALSDLPREQPIRDNLDAIAARSQRVDRSRRIVEALRPSVEAGVRAHFGRTMFLDRPTPARITDWRTRGEAKARDDSGHAHRVYCELRIDSVIEETAGILATGVHPPSPLDHARAVATGIIEQRTATDAGRLAFLEAHDLAFRIRRLRFLARSLATIANERSVAEAALDGVRDAVYARLARYLEREGRHFLAPLPSEPAEAFDAIAGQRDLVHLDLQTDAVLASAFAACPAELRRAALMAYLGFAFYDLATLALLQGDGLYESNPIKVDRISPEDATAIRTGGVRATLKGIQFNSFGAFFSRAYRENDYLWGRLHGADRLIDIIASTVLATPLPPSAIHNAKQAVFFAILDEEEPRLTADPDLVPVIRAEVAAMGGNRDDAGLD